MWRFRGRRLALVVGCLLVLAGVGITAHGLLQQAKVQQAVAARGQNDVNAVNSWLAGSASSGASQADTPATGTATGTSTSTCGGGGSD
jgi:hypothetical protein